MKLAGTLFALLLLGTVMAGNVSNSSCVTMEQMNNLLAQKLKPIEQQVETTYKRVSVLSDEPPITVIELGAFEARLVNNTISKKEFNNLILVSKDNYDSLKWKLNTVKAEVLVSVVAGVLLLFFIDFYLRRRLHG